MAIKICVIEPAGQEYGSELSLLDILKGLSGNRFNFEIILPKGSSFKGRLTELNIRVLEFLRIDLYRGRNVHRLFSYVRIVLHWMVHRPDVILVNQSGILRGIALCNLFFRRPIVCFVTTLEDAEHVSKQPEWVTNFVPNFICNSEYTAARLDYNEKRLEANIVYRGYPSNHQQVIYCSYPPRNLFSQRPPWSPNNKDHMFVIGILGRICKSKGHDLLLNTLNFLNDSGSKWLPRLAIVFIGDYQQQEKDAMKQMIALSPIPVEVTGYRPDIAPELARLHLLLIPSIAEPFGRIVQEAADAGLPVIASDSGGLGEICSRFNYGILFRYPDISFLASLIEHVMENYEQVLEESLNNREGFLAEFSYDKSMARIEQILVSAHEMYT